MQFRDDFLFCKILTERPDIAKELLELILNVRIEKVVPQKQKSIEITAEGREEGREAERTKMIQKLISKNYTKEQIFDLGYTEAEYAEAEKELVETV